MYGFKTRLQLHSWMNIQLNEWMNEWINKRINNLHATVTHKPSARAHTHTAYTSTMISIYKICTMSLHICIIFKPKDVHQTHGLTTHIFRQQKIFWPQPGVSFNQRGCGVMVCVNDLKAVYKFKCSEKAWMIAKVSRWHLASMDIKPIGIANEYNECKIHSKISHRLNPKTIMQHKRNINIAYIKVWHWPYCANWWHAFDKSFLLMPQYKVK